MAEKYMNEKEQKQSTADYRLHTAAEWERAKPEGVEFTEMQFIKGKVTKVSGVEIATGRTLEWDRYGECCVLELTIKTASGERRIDLANEAAEKFTVQELAQSEINGIPIEIYDIDCENYLL